MSKEKVTFDEIFNQNQRRIHCHIHKLNVQDPHQEFYQEGLVAIWNAYESYQPDKGPLATYFNYIIRNRMIDLIRKQKRHEEKQEIVKQEHIAQQEDGNFYRIGGTSYPTMIVAEGSTMYESDFWEKVKGALSENQWKWVKYFIIEEMAVKEIADQESVSVDAVKSWGREVKRKLRRKDLV